MHEFMHSELFFLFDTETTGLDPQKNQLLTMAVDIMDFDLNVLESFDFSFCYDSYTVSPKALEINKIDIITHHKYSSEIKKETQEKLLKMYSFFDTLAEKFIFAGHNVHFDVDMLRNCSHFDMNKFSKFAHRYLDTSSLAIEKVIQNKLPRRIGKSLPELCSYFNISSDGLHDARKDITMTRSVLKELIKL